MTVAELAEKTELDPSTFYKIIRGDRDSVKTKTIDVISRTLGYPSTYFVIDLSDKKEQELALGDAVPGTALDDFTISVDEAIRKASRCSDILTELTGRIWTSYDRWVNKQDELTTELNDRLASVKVKEAELIERLKQTEAVEPVDVKVNKNYPLIPEATEEDDVYEREVLQRIVKDNKDIEINPSGTPPERSRIWIRNSRLAQASTDHTSEIWADRFTGKTIADLLIHAVSTFHKIMDKYKWSETETAEYVYGSDGWGTIKKYEPQTLKTLINNIEFNEKTADKRKHKEFSFSRVKLEIVVAILKRLP